MLFLRWNMENEVNFIVEDSNQFSLQGIKFMQPTERLFWKPP